jgi:glycosyl transferase family 2
MPHITDGGRRSPGEERCTVSTPPDWGNHNTPSTGLSGWRSRVTTLSRPGISLVIPAWNEARRLRRTLDRYLPVLAASRVPFECIVVVDGALDGTARVVAEFADRGARLLVFPEKLGKGGAILKGFQYARYDTVGFVDADGPVPEAEFARMLELAPQTDCLVGTRGLFHHAGNLERNVAGMVWSLLVRLAFPRSVRDPQCGVKFFRKGVIAAVTPAVGLTNWAFDVSLLHHVRMKGFEIREVPFHWINGAGSQLNVLATSPFMLASLVGVRLSNPPFSSVFPRGFLSWLSLLGARVSPHRKGLAESKGLEVDLSELSELSSGPRPLSGPTFGASMRLRPRLPGAVPSWVLTPSAPVFRAGSMDGQDVPSSR